MFKKFFLLSLILILLAPMLPADLVFASTTEGTIDATYKYAWCENFGWINFGTANSNVVITDSGLTGYAWGENIGWINLSPSTSGVKNTDSGVLSGYAWGENVGWINFSGVTIDRDGYFKGYASGDITGSISFNCDNAGSCASSDFKVRTDWRPILYRGGGGVVGGGAETFASAGSSLSAGLKVLINHGAKYANSREILLEFDGGENSKNMAISEGDPNFLNANQESYVKNKKWTLKSGDGAKTIYARFYDIFGNASSVVSDSIILDTTSPINLKIISPRENQILSDNTPLLSGEAEQETKILISLGLAEENIATEDFKALMFFQTLADAKGEWQYEIPTPLKDGFYILSIQAEDEAGNTSNETRVNFSIKTSEEAIKPPVEGEQKPYFPVFPIFPKLPEEGETIPTTTPPIEEPAEIIPAAPELPEIKPEIPAVKPGEGIIKELKKVWQEVRQNIKSKTDFTLNLKDLVKRPISLVKENTKSLFNASKYIFIGFSKSTIALTYGAGKKTVSLFSKIAAGTRKTFLAFGSIFNKIAYKTGALAYGSGKKIVSLLSKIAAGTRKTFLAFGSIFDKVAAGKKVGSFFSKIADKIGDLAYGATRKVGSIFGNAILKTSALAFNAAKKTDSLLNKAAAGTKKTLVAFGSIFKKSSKVEIAPEVLVRIPSEAPKNIEAGKLLFTSKFGNIKIKSLEKSSATLIAGSQFKTFIKPNKPVKAIRAQLIFVETISRGDNGVILSETPHLSSFLKRIFGFLKFSILESKISTGQAKNSEVVARGNVMPNLVRHLFGNNLKILKQVQDDTTVLVQDDRKNAKDDIYRVGLALNKIETIGEKVAMATHNFIKKIIPAAFAQSAANEFIVGEYVYTDFDNDEVYSADIRLPDQEGKYYLKNIIDYQDNDKKVLETEILVTPSGYVYTPDPRGEIRLEGAAITLYKFNKAADKFEPFSAAVYNQKNPQITDKTGIYSYLAPAGKYYLTVDKVGYTRYTSKGFEIAEGQQISWVIELKVK